MSLAPSPWPDSRPVIDRAIAALPDVADPTASDLVAVLAFTVDSGRRSAVSPLPRAAGDPATRDLVDLGLAALEEAADPLVAEVLVRLLDHVVTQSEQGQTTREILAEASRLLHLQHRRAAAKGEAHHGR